MSENIDKILSDARREYRDSDAAGDVLDYIEERLATLRAAPAAEGAAPQASAGEDRQERIAVLKALSALDAMSEAWADEINLRGMAENIAKADDVPAAIYALVVQAWVEGAYTGRTSHNDSPPAPAAAPAPVDGMGWRSMSEAALLPRNLDGASGPCAVLLKIDMSRPGPFIRQGRFDVCAGGFVCDSTGQVLHDAIAFIRPSFAAAPTSAATPDDQLSSEVHRILDEGDGSWTSCSGCHETNEGYETGHYPYSDVFRCYLGGGCTECGGLGAVWEEFPDIAEMEAEARAATPGEAAHGEQAVERECERIARLDGIDWNDAEWQATHQIEAGRLRTRVAASITQPPAAPGAVGFWRDVYERCSYQLFRAKGKDSIRARECARLDLESRDREAAALAQQPPASGSRGVDE